jgi:hypothetical protein
MKPDADDLAARLVESEQRLGSQPDLEHRLERALDENARLRRELEDAWRENEVLTSSSSWRLTKPLRRLMRSVRMRRP